MGEVYRARDTRLNRDVAIKVLREDDAASVESRSRFEREARAIAALNHPNIVAVYDFGIEAGQQYIVSELVEGESRGRLAAAHAAGVVHRDLKPENIMLAKETCRAPTQTFVHGADSGITKAGAVLGTARYVSSPEQALGKPIGIAPTKNRTMDEKVPAPLRWIIDRCLQKEPEQRYKEYEPPRHISEAHSSAVFAPIVVPEEAKKPLEDALLARSPLRS